jgi:hypothetical protein
MTMAAPMTAGSTLVTVDRSQAGDYQRSLATLGHRLPLGWDATGWQSRVAGYDLLLATPRTLSALGWFLMDTEDDSSAGRSPRPTGRPPRWWRWSSPPPPAPRRPA